MGRMQAEEILAQVGKHNALAWHLQSNHYPPVPLAMIPACEEAIDHANTGDWDTLIQLPKGVFYRGDDKAPVSAIISQHHLDSFLEQEEI